MVKNLIAILIASIFFGSCASTQKVSESDYKELVLIHEVNLNKDLIYDKIMKWFVSSYNSPKSAIEYSDKKGGLIAFKGSCNHNMNPVYNHILNYKIVINIKDNKYKIEMTPLTWVYTGAGQTGSEFTKGMFTDLKKEYTSIDSGIISSLTGKENDF